MISGFVFQSSTAKSNIYLNIKLSGRHIAEVWLPKHPLKPPGRAAPGSPKPAALVLAALKLVLTLHLNGGSEAPRSETPHHYATTSEVEPASLGVQGGPLCFPHQRLCVCLYVCLTDASLVCFVVAFVLICLLTRRSACMASSLPAHPACHFDFPAVRLLVWTPPASLSISLTLYLPDRLAVF